MQATIAAQHTAGPYRRLIVYNTETKQREMIVCTPYKNLPNGEHESEQEIANLGSLSPTVEANAKLLAAAPDLLKALRAIVRDCEEVLAGREPLTMDLIHAIAKGKAASAIERATRQDGSA